MNSQKEIYDNEALYCLNEKDYMIEKLADFEHDRWSRWQNHLFSKCIVNNDGSLTIPKKFVDRWTRQMNTDYISLSENEKASDRKEAIRIIRCINNKEHVDE